VRLCHGLAEKRGLDFAALAGQDWLMPFAAKIAVLIAVLGSVGRIGYQLVRLWRERRAMAEIMRDTGEPDPAKH